MMVTVSQLVVGFLTSPHDEETVVVFCFVFVLFLNYKKKVTKTYYSKNVHDDDDNATDDVGAGV